MVNYLDACSPEQAATILRADDTPEAAGQEWPMTESYPARLRIAHLGRAAQALIEMDVSPRGALVVHAATGDAPAAALNRRIAQEALHVVRLAKYDRRFGALKSSNKWPSAVETPPDELLLGQERMRANDLRPFSARSALHRSALYWACPIANCGDLTSNVQDVVAHRHPTVQTALVSLEGIDHHFAVIGAVHGDLCELPMAEWPDHLWVCDPWGNLACAARDFPQAIQRKMEKWDRAGKRVIVGEGKSRRWGSPLDENWRECLSQAPSVFVRRQYEGGQFVLIPLSDHRINAAGTVDAADNAVEESRPRRTAPSARRSTSSIPGGAP